jgi:hypothetical protein
MQSSQRYTRKKFLAGITHRRKNGNNWTKIEGSCKKNNAAAKTTSNNKE